MKNIDIINLCNAGFLTATGHSLPVEHFYKFIKWKRSAQKAYEEATKSQRAFLTEAGLTIDDARPGANPDAEKAKRYNALNEAMLDEEVEMPAVRIPLECYKGLYDENKTENGDLFANLLVEGIVLDNLFEKEE